MSLKLNKILNEILLENLQDTSSRYTSMISQPPNNPSMDDLVRYYSALAEDSRDIGLMRYQQEYDANKVREYLTLASEHIFQLWNLPEIEIPNSYHGPIAFENNLSLIVCFSDRTKRAALADMPRWKYCSGATSEERSIADFIGILISHISGKEVDREACNALISTCNSNLATKEQKLFLLPKVEGLINLVDKNQEMWLACINNLLLAHAHEAKSGILKLRYVGLLCLPALMLAKLGIENGLKCTLTSPYLPLSLLVN